MLKKALTFLAGSLLVTTAAAAPRTMRVDYDHTGNASEERFALDRVVLEPLEWPGNPARPLDDTNLGTYFFEVLDRKTKELVAIAASLAAKCQGCLEGHIKKAMKAGASREEISETIAITMGVGAAAVVDLTDIAADNLDLKLY